MAISYVRDRSHAPIHLWTPWEGVEPEAQQQLLNISRLPWVHDHIAVMPDVHFGKGATVGSVIAMKGAVAPSAVGVDIGCGMMAEMTNLTAADLPDDLSQIRADIEASIPVGFHEHATTDHTDHLDGLWSRFVNLHEGVQDRFEKARRQLGTLGGGNHFIELCLDDQDRVWLMLHSGSRNIGKEIAERHIKVAKTLEHNNGIPDPDLAVFLQGTEEFARYAYDLSWAQIYAASNRIEMMHLYKKALKKHFPSMTSVFDVNCHHNYVSEEHHNGADVLVTRKGAISAAPGEYGIIPGSMGTRSYIVRGLGNGDAFNSASHGAGRRMSRTKARKTFTTADLAAQTAGIECRKDADVVDEIPAAYKDIDEVMANQKDLVEVHAVLRQVLCVKG